MANEEIVNDLVQTYVLLSDVQIAKIRELFEVSERDDISHAVQIIVEQSIKEHTKEDIKKLQADNAWDNFSNKFNNGWFSDRLQR